MHYALESYNRGSPSSKYEHRRTSALLRNIQNIRISRDLGSCLLQVVSTDLSVDITVDIAVDTRLIQRSIVGRQSVETRTMVGRHSVETRSIVVPEVSRLIRLFVFRYFTDTSPMVRRYFTDVSVSKWPTLGRWSVDTWSIVRRQQEHLKEFMWRRWHGELRTNGCFGRLMQDIAEQYPL